jgi:molybdopterin-guanine dinucleotide biosynthesis protein A
VVVAGDMPGLSSELIALMASRAARDKKTVVLSDAGGVRPLPALLRVAPALALARTLLESGERRLRALVEGLEAERLPEAVWGMVDARGAWRDDVNTPDDLARKRP